MKTLLGNFDFANLNRNGTGFLLPLIQGHYKYGTI